jgi:hypothetical protein
MRVVVVSEDANPVQIFISYARDDDAPPPEAPDSLGFVTTLHDQLLFEFKRLGHPRPKLWRDTKSIEKAHQFEPRLEEAIKKSSLLLVVLSKNWMASEWCRRELETFAEHWRGDPGLRERIIVASKRHVDPDKRPSLLQGQSGYDFYRRTLDEPGDDGLEQEFFARGKARDPRYYDVIEELAGVLWRMAERRGAKPGEKIRAPQNPVRPPPPAPNGRTIYVAKPATDMQTAYDSVVKELVGSGYAVVPDPTADIPGNSSALDFIDEQLEKAEVSVHLLGEKAGFTPEDQEQPIVKLQLARAAEREANCADSADDNGSRFRRIVWAPKILDEESTANAAERTPNIVLMNFTEPVGSDKIVGDNRSKFVIFLKQYLVETPPPKSVSKSALGGSRVYLYHSLEDTDYASELASGFESRQVEPILPVFEGPPADVANFHREQLMKCDAVVVCWAAASEVWARAHASELRDWAGLGRSEKFAYRSVIAGPPPGGRKKAAKRVFPRNEIDVVLDLTSSSHPAPEALDPLFGASA